MATAVVMPQMGESIAEGTIVRWIKKVGDTRRSRRAAVRDLDGQGGRRDSVAGGRRAHRDQGQGRRDRSGQRRRRHDRRSTARRQRRNHGRRRRHAALRPLRLLAGLRPRHPRSRRAMALLLPPRRPRRPAPSASDVRSKPNGQGTAQSHSKDDLRRQKSSPLVRRIAKRPQRRHHVVLGLRHRRPRHQDTTSWSSSTGSRRPVAAARPAAPVRSRRAENPGERRRDPAALRDAQEDRGAHDPEPADVGARAFGLPRELLDHREDPAAEEGGVRSDAVRSSLTWRSSRRRSSTRSVAIRSSTPRSTVTTSSTRRT